MTKTLQVRGYTRKTRSGKTIKVKGYTRKYAPKKKEVSSTPAYPVKVAPGREFINKKAAEERWGGPAPKWTAEDYEIQKAISNMSAADARRYARERKKKKAEEAVAEKNKKSFWSKLFK